MTNLLRPSRNGSTTPTPTVDGVPSLTDDVRSLPNRSPVTSGPSGRPSQDLSTAESPEMASRNMSLTINGTGTWASSANEPDARNGVGSPSLMVQLPEAREVNGISSDSQSSEHILTPPARHRHPDPAQSQTPVHTSPTPETATPLPSLPASTPAQSHLGNTSESIRTQLYGRSTAIDSQLDQPPEMPGRNRRRRRFVRWISSRFHHHGPWVPGAQRNRNIISNAIANVDRLFRGGGR